MWLSCRGVRDGGQGWMVSPPNLGRWASAWPTRSATRWILQSYAGRRDICPRRWRQLWSDRMKCGTLGKMAECFFVSKIESVFLSQSWSIWSIWSTWSAESRDRWTCSLCRKAWRFQHEWKSLRRLSFYRCTGDAKHWKETLGMSDSKLMNPQKCNRICSTRLLRLGKPQPLWFDWDWCLRVRGFKAFQAELWCFPARWMLQSLFAFELLRRLAH